jgi:DNA-directed RNA polymerase subunit RPC12/RpoP
MTTPNKCAKADWRDACEVDFYDGVQKCVHCGAKFVPSDLLEELKETLEIIEWMGDHPTGDLTCVYCGARAFDIDDGPHRKHKDGCRVEEDLARIDAVLGKEETKK